MSDIIGHEPEIFTFDNVDDPPTLGSLHLARAGEEAGDGPWFHADFLTHHKRMVTATAKIKARRDFIDGNSTDS
jgi:hypothetical protein